MVSVIVVLGFIFVSVNLTVGYVGVNKAPKIFLSLPKAAVGVLKAFLSITK